MFIGSDSSSSGLAINGGGGNEQEKEHRMRTWCRRVPRTDRGMEELQPRGGARSELS